MENLLTTYKNDSHDLHHTNIDESLNNQSKKPLSNVQNVIKTIVLSIIATCMIDAHDVQGQTRSKKSSNSPHQLYGVVGLGAGNMPYSPGWDEGRNATFLTQASLQYNGKFIGNKARNISGYVQPSVVLYSHYSSNLAADVRVKNALGLALGGGIAGEVTVSNTSKNGEIKIGGNIGVEGFAINKDYEPDEERSSVGKVFAKTLEHLVFGSNIQRNGLKFGVEYHKQGQSPDGGHTQVSLSYPLLRSKKK